MAECAPRHGRKLSAGPAVGGVRGERHPQPALVGAYGSVRTHMGTIWSPVGSTWSPKGRMVRALGNEGGGGGLPGTRHRYSFSSRLSFPPLWRQTPRPPGASLRGRGGAPERRAGGTGRLAPKGGKRQARRKGKKGARSGQPLGPLAGAAAAQAPEKKRREKDLLNGKIC